MRVSNTPLLSFAIVSNLALSATAHMVFAHKAVWGLKTQGGSLETPLNMKTGKNWPHHGAKKDTTDVVTFKPGDNPSFPVVCGEAIKNPSGAKGTCKTVGDVHKGGGCALAIAYDPKDVPEPEDFIVFSVVHDCPSFSKFDHNFEIPSNLPACKKCICAWTWIPNPNSSADEMYMNTFNCAVSGTKTGKIGGGRKPNYFGVVGYEGKGKQRPMYKSTFPNGAQKLVVSGEGSGGATPTKSGDPTTTKSEGPTASATGGSKKYKDDNKAKPTDEKPGKDKAKRWQA